VVRTKLAGHLDTVNSIQVSGDRLLSASDDGTARLWDLRTGKSSTLLRHPTRDPIAVAKWCDNYVVSAVETTINLFDVRKPTLLV